MGLSQAELIAVVAVVVLGIILAALFLFISRRLRQRQTQLRKELASPERQQDRAFNRIAMARRELFIIERTGAEVDRARTLVAEAQGAYDTAHYDRAYESAQSAHEALVAARQGRPLTGGSSASSPPLPHGSGAPRAAGNGPLDVFAAPAGAPAPAPIAKNRAESQFQLHLLDDELAQAKAVRPGDGSVATADALGHQAHGAFDAGNFTEAFRLGLRARRQLGGRVESLAATPGAPVGGPGGEGADDDADSAAERAASANRCPDCGYPLVADDRFCRGCGRPQTTSVCPVCQAPRSASDTFCGKCGAAFP
jgi:hypothetical protein